MTTVASTTPPPAKPWLKPLAAVLGTSVLLAVLVIAFALPASRSGAHDVPIGVVGTPAQIVGFEKAAHGIKVQIYASETDARTAIAHREVYGALVLDSPTDVDILYSTAASPAVATMVQTIGQHIADATHRTAHLSDVRAFPARDPKGIGLAAGALPLALGGWMGAMVIMLLVPNPGRRVAAAIGVAVVGGLTVVATLQFLIGTFDGNYWLTSLAGMFGIAATCFTVLGLRELLGGAGLGIAAVLLVLLGNPLSGLSSAPELLPQPWGHLGQLLPPGATGALMRDVSLFDGHGATRPVLTLACYLVLGLTLYGLGLKRARRRDTVDVDRIEFDHRPRHTTVQANGATAGSITITEPMGLRHRRPPHRQPIPANAEAPWPPPTSAWQQPTSTHDAERQYFIPQRPPAPRPALPAAPNTLHHDRPRPRPQSDAYNHPPKDERWHAPTRTSGTSPAASALPPPWWPPREPSPATTTSPRSAPRAAVWPPARRPPHHTQTSSKINACARPALNGAGTGSTSNSTISDTTINATTMPPNTTLSAGRPTPRQ